jgi:TetR/AcrR family transcriptional regulator, transcriptional repressor for nem operon
VFASPALRHPLTDTFAWLTGRFTEIFAQGQADGEFDATLDPAEVGAALAAVLQGGYVLARSANSVQPFHRAISGALSLLSASAPATD